MIFVSLECLIIEMTAMYFNWIDLQRGPWFTLISWIAKCYETLQVMWGCCFFLMLFAVYVNPLTQWGRVPHICVDKLTISGSDNGSPPGRRQAIIWTNAGIVLIWHSGTNFSGIWNLSIFIFWKYIWKCRLENGGPSFWFGLNVLRTRLVL